MELKKLKRGHKSTGNSTRHDWNTSESFNGHGITVVERGHKNTSYSTRHDWNTSESFNRHGVKVVEERTQEHWEFYKARLKEHF